MKLPLLYEALCELPHKLSSDGRQISLSCIFCGDSSHDRDAKHLSIKIEPDDGEPVLYRCWLAKCGKSGILNTYVLQQLGITDLEVISELSAYNRSINKNYDKLFVVRKPKKYEPVNLASQYNEEKLAYINRRLGTNLTFGDMRTYKIQLSLYDMLNINSIKRLAFSRDRCDTLDAYTIGFISMYSDYLICRDITKDLKTGMRYTNYRISGKINPDDMKLYSIPREIDLLDPHSAIINIAEGPFSILGAYLNTDIGTERPNSVWIANCGSDYRNNILHVCKQYGLLKVRINIWSDSEVKLDKYQKLYQSLKDMLDIQAFRVLYNRKADDFGHARKDIRIETATIK